MGGSRFDAWTRRRLGLAVGSLTISLAGRADAGPVGARKNKKQKKKKKKRCINLGNPCTSGARACCSGRTCGGPPPSTFCCKQGGEPCVSNQDCCNVQCVQGTCALN